MTTDLADRFAGMLAASAVPEQGRRAAWRPPALRSALTAARALLSGRPRSIVPCPAAAAAVAGAFHWGNPWLRYRAAACSPPRDGVGLLAAASCQLVARAAALAVTLPLHGAPGLARLEPEQALADLGWSELRHGAPPVPRSMDTMAAAELWETVWFALAECARHRGGMAAAGEILVGELGIRDAATLEAMLAVYSFARADGTSVRTAKEDGPLACMLAAARYGRAILPVIVGGGVWPGRDYRLGRMAGALAAASEYPEAVAVTVAA